MKAKGLTVSFIFEAQSANYGESIGNIATLKKMSRGDGEMYSYISRQALRFSIVEQAVWNATPVEASGSGKNKVVQFAPTATISEYPEIDLFGYMKTTGKGAGAKTRSAVARLSHAIALEPMSGDYDFLNNMGLAKRRELDNNLSQSEIHHSLYAYTVAIDLERVGVERDVAGAVVEEISAAEKAQRVTTLLKTLQYLYRDIKGRRENLAPVLAIGGVYDCKNPFFEGRLKVKKNAVDTVILGDVLKDEAVVGRHTKVGCVAGFFRNQAALESVADVVAMPEFFAWLNQAVEEYYAAGN